MADLSSLSKSVTNVHISSQKSFTQVEKNYSASEVRVALSQLPDTATNFVSSNVMPSRRVVDLDYKPAENIKASTVPKIPSVDRSTKPSNLISSNKSSETSYANTTSTFIPLNELDKLPSAINGTMGKDSNSSEKLNAAVDKLNIQSDENLKTSISAISLSLAETCAAAAFRESSESVIKALPQIPTLGGARVANPE